MNGLIAARSWGFGVGALCMILSACAPVPETVATSGCDSAPAALASDPNANLESRKAAALKILTDRSTVAGEDKDGALAIRQIAVLWAFRQQAAEGVVLSPELAEVRDSVMRIPGVLQAVTTGENKLALGKARNDARRQSKGAHLMTALADTADYYAMMADVVTSVSDTTVVGGDLYPAILTIASTAKAAFPTDTAFASWADEASLDPTVVRDVSERGIAYAWANEGMTGPSWSLARTDCELTHWPNGNTIAWPHWITAAAQFVATAAGGAILGARIVGKAVTAAAVAEGVIGAIAIAGVEYAASYIWTETMAIAHEIELKAAVCVRAAHYGSPCHLLMRSRADHVSFQPL